MPNIAEAVERFEEAVRRHERLTCLLSPDARAAGRWGPTFAEAETELAESRAALAAAMRDDRPAGGEVTT